MKKTIIALGSSAVLGAALFLTGCETAPETKPVATSTPVASVPATPEPPKFDAMATATKIKDGFTAIKDAAAKKDFMAAGTAVMGVKEGLGAMVAGLPASKAMVDPIVEKVTKAGDLLGKKDAGAFKMLTEASDAFGKIDLAKLTTGGVMDAAKGLAGAAAGAVTGAAGAVVDKAKEAGSAAAGAAASGAEKAAGAVEKGAAAVKDAAKDAKH